MEFRRLGLVPYREALKLQDELVGQRQAEAIPDTVLLLEHPPVITLGRVGSERYVLDAGEVEVIRTGRGGEVTWHGPGQLVAWPIVHTRDLHRHLRWLEAALIGLAATYGLAAQQSEGRTGVWVGEEKLASIGVRASRWVTSHGLALNVGPDVSGFDRIVPCGLEGVRMTSLALQVGRTPEWDEVQSRLEDQLRGKRHIREAGAPLS